MPTPLGPPTGLVGGPGLGGTGGLFDVWIPTLNTGASNLAVDSAEVSTETGDGSSAATAGQGACGGGPLAEALGRLADDLTSQGGGLTDALAAGGTRLTSNAQTYLGDDATASGSFSAWSAGSGLTW